MKKVFPYIYSLFILSQFLIGQIYLPGFPLNILQISTLLLLSICIIIEQKLPRDRYIILYCIFLIFYFISSIFTGYMSALFAVSPQVLISFTAFWGTKILVQRYDTLLPLIFPVVVAGTVDAVVTILQATGHTIVSPIILMLIQNPDYINLAADGMLGHSISGIYINPVFNGHSLLFCFVCSLFMFQGRHRLISFVFSGVILSGLFFCQQRSAFYLSIIVLLILGWKMIKNNIKPKFFLILFAFVFIIFLLPLIESYVLDSGSRLIDTDTTNREEIWSSAASFLSRHILFGGFDMFVNETGKYPHNLFFSSFLAGGLLGGFVMMILVCRVLYGAFKSLKYFNGHNISLLVSVCLISSLIADSLTHNIGLVEADFSTFLAISICFYYNESNPHKVFRLV